MAEWAQPDRITRKGTEPKPIELPSRPIRLPDVEPVRVPEPVPVKVPVRR